MANTILHKRSSTASSTPLANQLSAGELALNTADSKVFMKNSAGTVVEVSYRDARVDARLSGGTGITYTSGVIAVDSTIATLTGTQTLTNKSISGATNTLSAIGNASLTNSSTTIGTTAIALGASSTTLVGLTSVTSTGFTGALTGNADTATALATGRTIDITGDITYTSPSFTGAGNVTAAATLATVNSTVGSFGSSTLVPVITVNAKGLVTSVTTSSISGALTFTGDVTGSGTTGSSTALTIGSGVVTNTMLAGSIANNKLVNSSTTIGSTAIALGASSTTLAGLTSVTSTGFTGALTGNASTATILATARNIQGVSFDGSAAITVVTAGTGVTVSGTAVSIGQAVATSSNVTFNDLTVAGNLTVSGTTTSINTTTLNVADLNVTVANGAATAAAANGAGLTVAGPATPATLTYTSADDRWNFNKSLNATLVGNVTGNVTGTSGSTTGNAATATTLATARAIQGVSFDGSAAITVVTAGTGISVSGTAVSTSAIPNASLTNSTITIGSTSTALGATSTTLAGLTSVTSTTFVGALTGNASTATSATSATTAGTVTTAAQTAITSVGTLTGLTSSGAVSITNSTASSSKTTGALIVTGGVGVSGAMYVGGEITAYASDAALKTNVEVIENALEKVEAIRGVSYDWNEDGLALGLTDAKQVGVIAQEVEAVIPELVCDSAHAGYKTVKYDKLTALLIEAVKELSAKVRVLEAQLGGKPGL
jgi:hypothetical protein